MTGRRPFIPQKRPVFIGCEGSSEASYAAFLQRLILVAGLPVHLVIQELCPGAGDPLDRVELAVKKLIALRKRRVEPRERFVLLDFDQAARDAARASRAAQIARNNDIEIVWQRPCFEAVLLRHLDGKSSHRPPDSPTALRALKQSWSDYSKPMPSAQLAKRLDLLAVRRAASVEPELLKLLRCIGLN